VGVFDTIQTVLPYSGLDRRIPSQGLPVYNLDLVRQLCMDVTREKDPEKERDLVSLLQAVINSDAEEIRMRLAFLAKKYPISDSGSQAAD
jgi:hypothetical protein